MFATNGSKDMTKVTSLLFINELHQEGGHKNIADCTFNDTPECNNSDKTKEKYLIK